jgi:serine/threonine protein kinase
MDGFEVGTKLRGKYRVDGPLGKGAYGSVLLVTNLRLNVQQALKVLLRAHVGNPEVVKQFIREAQAAARLRSDHVIKIFDLDRLDDHRPYVSMEYLRGTNLKEELQRRTLSADEAVDYLLQACDALAEAHARGLVHRDIKPENLFLTEEPRRLKVFDFGQSIAPSSDLSQLDRQDHGTVGYMSPEQMTDPGCVDRRTDIWALGIVLYECLAGVRPFQSDSEGTESTERYRVIKAPVPALGPSVPADLQSIILRCLEKTPVKRYSSIAELAAALVPFSRDQSRAESIRKRVNRMADRSDDEPARTTDATEVDMVLQEQRAHRDARSTIMIIFAAVFVIIVVVFMLLTLVTRPGSE